MSQHGGLQLQVAARAENIARIRHEVGAAAAHLGLSEGSVADLQIIASEACANAVRYAYGDDAEGPIEVNLTRTGAASVLLTIRDRGGGIRPRPESELPSLKLGLPIIGALSSRFCLTSELGSGTELEIEMPIGGRDD